MRIAEIGTGTRRRAPLPDGPTVEPLTPLDASEHVAIVHMEFPSGAGLPEHDHGSSHIVLIPLSGAIELRYDGQVQTLSSGSAAHVGAGERISLANRGTEPASLLMVATPPEFVGHLAEWPAV